jgi:hypothetical protein
VRRGCFGLIMIAGGAFVAAAAFSGCQSPQTPVVVEDRAHGDSHKWDESEESAYRRWEAERQKEHQDYAKRPENERTDYWNWRHTHP